MKPLSPTQRTAIRCLHDKPGLATPAVSPNTLRSLRQRRLVHASPSWKLTALGEQTYERIMESGDGPEDLKEMFRFARAR